MPPLPLLVLLPVMVADVDAVLLADKVQLIDGVEDNVGLGLDDSLGLLDAEPLRVMLALDVVLCDCDEEALAVAEALSDAVELGNDIVDAATVPL